MSYSALSDLYVYGASQTAFGQLSDATKQAALDLAYTIVNSYLRGRYQLPLLPPYTVELIDFECRIATYNLLSVRGYNPGAGSDPVLETRYKQALHELELVQKSMKHLEVTPTPDQSPNYNQPTVLSSSVVHLSSGAIALNRGW